MGINKATIRATRIARDDGPRRDVGHSELTDQNISPTLKSSRTKSPRYHYLALKAHLHDIVAMGKP